MPAKKKNKINKIVKTKEDIKKFILQWKKILHITDWYIHIYYHEELQDKNKHTFAYVERDGKYKRAYIHISNKILADYLEDKNKQEFKKIIFQSILHELVHIILNDYDNMVENTWKTESEFELIQERTAETLAWILYEGYKK